ncbi:MAG: GNAT family N-acetyltransferase [Pelagimonas sp.]|jgi:RimJ/RimL family protein N-acetyltransferase|nr:GNAT family N-acetyltransferase [Pelagimonas sp.]
MNRPAQNSLGQPIGWPVTGTFPRPRPPHHTLSGAYTTLLPLKRGHAQALFDAFAQDHEGRGWTYLPIEPWHHQSDAESWCDTAQSSTDPLFYSILDSQGVISGFCSLLRIDPQNGVIETGYIHYAPRLQRSRAATETMYLLMRHVFEDLGYRRYEWKCDALNAPSRAAAERLGFTFEGIFRQATHYKGRNRDTAWFSMLDSEWPIQKARFETWLSPDNFDAEGQQKSAL